MYLFYICWLSFQTGWTGIITFPEQEQLVATLLLHEIVWKRETAINQLLQGLKLLNVLDMIQKLPQQFWTFFFYDGVLTVSVLKEHMHFNEASNTFEERVKDFFFRYIDEDVVISCGEGILTL